MNENRRTMIRTAKILLGLACLWLIASRLYDSYTPDNLRSVKDIFSSDKTLFLSVCFLLLFVNWGIEVYKWKLITAPIEKISFRNAWQSVWTGVCIGNLTPGRLGEFAGRILFFSPHVRAKIATSHFVVGITQLIVTVVAGCTGLLVFSHGLNSFMFTSTLIIELTLLTVLCVALLRINKVVAKLLHIRWFRKFNFEGLSYERPLLFKLIFFSVMRYLVFSFQFYLLLVCCGAEGNIFRLAAAIAIMYLVLSTIPMISFIEVAVRAYVAVLLFGSFNQNAWQLSVASTLLWFINIAIPSIIGYLFILKNNFTFKEGKNVDA